MTFLVFFLLLPVAVSAQAPSGYVSAVGDYFPNRDDAAELRARLFAEQVIDPAPTLIFVASGFVEGLVARRGTVRTDAILRVQEATVEYKGGRADLLAGFGTVVWGRLDELQPTDVINPLDVSRFFFDGRGEARMPVGLVRGRLFLSESASIEAIYVPFFRRGRFDQLDEPTSPFNIAAAAFASPLTNATALPFELRDREPPASFGNAQGGARVSATAGRLDWSLSAYRGFEPFGLYRAGVPAPGAASFPVDAVYPRFTMLGGDFETVAGEWGFRGEIAAFVEDSFQDRSLSVVDGRSLDAGLGVDRKAGDYRLSATVLLHRESYDAIVNGDEARTDVSLVVASDRSFARERYQLRAFGVYNASEESAFLRAIATSKLRDDLAIDCSVGWFVGDGRDVTGRFADSDFIYARVKYYF